MYILDEHNYNNPTKGIYDFIKYIKDDNNELKGLSQEDIENKIAEFLNTKVNAWQWFEIVYNQLKDRYYVNYGSDSSD